MGNSGNIPYPRYIQHPTESSEVNMVYVLSHRPFQGKIPDTCGKKQSSRGWSYRMLPQLHRHGGYQCQCTEHEYTSYGLCHVP